LVVLIGPRGEEGMLSVVRDDEETGMRLVTEALLHSGHRRIAAVVERVNGHIDPTGRLARLRAHLSAAGVELLEENAVIWDGSAESTLARALALHPRPTALFVWHDRAAYRITEACDAAGIRVPTDLSVVGYDGLVWPSTSGHTVASAAVPLPALAHRAVGLLHRLIEGEAGPFTETISISFHPGTTLGLPLATP
ncbi:LacI family transcriptional regulator, partial [bacterium]